MDGLRLRAATLGVELTGFQRRGAERRRGGRSRVPEGAVPPTQKGDCLVWTCGNGCPLRNGVFRCGRGAAATEGSGPGADDEALGLAGC